MRIPRKNNGNNAEVRIDVACNLYKNGVLVATAHNSITNFDWFGKRFFDPTASPLAPALYQVIKTNHAGDLLVLKAGKITKISNGVYETSITYVNTDADPTIYNWSGGYVQFANSTDEQYKVAAGTWSVNWTGGDTLIQAFVFTVTGAGLTDAGKKTLALRIFSNTARTLTAFATYNYTPYVAIINPMTYAGISATVHTLSCNVKYDHLANSFALWDNGWVNSSYVKTFRDFRVYKSSIQEVVKITLSQS